MRAYERLLKYVKFPTMSDATKPEKARKQKPKRDEYLIIDGYNLIFAWDDLRRMAENDVSLARDALIRLSCNYSAMKKCRVIVVFDAYRRKGQERELLELGGVTVIYTKEAQTADAYIEKTTYEIAGEHFVRVVTSDMQEQYVILGNGAYRVSPKEFRAELDVVLADISELSRATS